MNFKGFGTFVLAFGIALSILGGGIIILNQPPSPQDMEIQRAHNDGSTLLVAGVVATFIGIAIKVVSYLTGDRRLDRPMSKSPIPVSTYPRDDQRMPTVDMREQTRSTDSQPLARCPKCGDPTFDLRNHRCRTSVPGREY